MFALEKRRLSSMEIGSNHSENVQIKNCGTFNLGFGL